MKALLLSNPAPVEASPLKQAELPMPEPGPRELLLRVEACGICHTDLHQVEGDIPMHKTPVVPGHQVVRVVEKVGARTRNAKPGDRVGVSWLHQACGECSFCRTGRENLCPLAKFTGYDVDGGYAQYMVAPHAFISPVPESFSSPMAAPLLCGGVIGYRALKLAGAGSGEVVALYGFGASAHVVIQVAVHWGCRVQVFTRGREHQELAMRLGAEWAGAPQDKAPEQAARAIIFAPAGWLVPVALQGLERGGILVLAGLTMSAIPEMPYALVYEERTVRSVANATRRDARDLLRLAAEIPIRTEVQVFPVEEANQALRLLKSGGINGAGVLQVG